MSCQLSLDTVRRTTNADFHVVAPPMDTSMCRLCESRLHPTLLFDPQLCPFLPPGVVSRTHRIQNAFIAKLSINQYKVLCSLCFMFSCFYDVISLCSLIFVSLYLMSYCNFISAHEVRCKCTFSALLSCSYSCIFLLPNNVILNEMEGVFFLIRKESCDEMCFNDSVPNQANVTLNELSHLHR